MNEQNRSPRIMGNIKIAVFILIFIWGVFFLDFLLPADLRHNGLRPRRVDGLWGILFAPFLHGNIQHLAANSGILFVLLIAALSFSRKQAVWALLIIVVVSGLAVWAFGGPNTVHIGASGVIFGLIGYLLFIGIFHRRWKALLFSAAVFLVYGGVLAGLFVVIPGVSWSGHFYGFLSGVMAAWLTRGGRDWKELESRGTGH